MRLDNVEHGQLLAPGADKPSGNGWRSQPPARRAGSWALKAVAVVALIAAGVWAYRANVSTGRPAMDMNMRVSSGDTPFPVALAPVERGAMRGTVVYTGSVAPFNEEDIFPRVTGRIVDIPVYPGDAVRAGQVVARLDDIELSSRVREAEAGAASAQANRAQMEADVVAAEHGVVQAEKELAMVEAELAYARAVAARSEQLVGVGAISRQEYENDRAMALSQAAKREAARAKIEQSRAMEASARRKVDAADSMVAQGRAALRTATVVRDYVTIVAPSTGYVVKRLVAPGVLVQPGMPILKIAQVDRVRLQANVGEKDIAAIQVGSPVGVTTTAGQSFTTRVTSVFPFVDQGPRTAVVEAIVDNRDRRLLPGQYVTMQLVTGERANAITVPRGAVARLGGAAKVWVVSDGRAGPREVSTGLEGPERVEIVRGLTGTEQVVARGHENLYAGARVADATATAPAAPGNVPASPAKSDEMRSTPRKENGHAGH
jgi:HlyD family secretion protein